MSFSSEVKQELLAIVPQARHCQIAEIAAFLRFLGTKDPAEEQFEHGLVLKVDSEEAASLLFTLFQRAYNIDMVIRREPKRARSKGESILLSLPSGYGAGAVWKSVSHRSVLQMECCKKAFLRGAFIAAGSVSAPEKSYHLEFVCRREEEAELLLSTMSKLGFGAKAVLRKGDYVVYLKEGDQVTSLLGIMGGSHSFLSIESVRVMKEMRGRVNRRVNCETANLGKTVASAVRQIEDITYLRDHGGFAQLPPALVEMAEARLQYPDASLLELGSCLDPPIGKSGVNHRLRKLSEIAGEMRNKSAT